MATRPHIVLVTCHDLGRHIGPYGVDSVRTPALDELAADGVRFRNSFCTSPGCSPSRAALATGRYPHCNGVLGLAHAHFGWELGPDERHLARLLAENGYYPVLFGLQHVTYHLDSLGFREVYAERPADAVAANLERFLASRAGGDPLSGPLYLEINFFEPHRPFDFGGVTADTTRGVWVPPYLPDSDAARSELALMQGAIHKVDQSIARIRAALEQAGILEETIFVFTADHGIAFPRAKGTLYDPGIETALLIRWPAGGLNGGIAPDILVSNVDIAPSLLELAGVPVPGNIQGRSFAPYFSGGDYTQHTAVFAEKTFHNEYDPLRCIRTPHYKLIARFEVANPVEVPADIMRGPTYVEMIGEMLESHGGGFELYDLARDPQEQENLAARPELSDVEAELKAWLRRWMANTGDPLLRGPVASPYFTRTLQALEEA